jgi:hypothetical protein
MADQADRYRVEIARLFAEATDETRAPTHRDWCARRIPHVQARLFALLARRQAADRDGGEEPDVPA